jgi:hypothetical protein
MVEMVTSRRVPFFTNAGMSAVIMTAATFLEDKAAAGTFTPNRCNMLATLCNRIDRVLVAFAGEPGDEPVTHELVVPRPRHDGQVLDAGTAGVGRRNASVKHAEQQTE